MTHMTIKKRKQAMLYRSTHRGCKEMDIILGNFVTKHLETLKEDELTDLENLCESEDYDLYKMLISNSEIKNSTLKKIQTWLNKQYC